MSSISFNDTATTEIYTLSLHDALPISVHRGPADRALLLRVLRRSRAALHGGGGRLRRRAPGQAHRVHRGSRQDRKSTRLNSSHGYISYAVFCLKKKNTGT